MEVSESPNYENVNIYTFWIKSAVSGGVSLKMTEEAFPGGEARLFGSTVLDNKMRGVKLHSLVKIVYKGKTIATKRGKAKDYEVFEDDAYVPKGAQQKVKEGKTKDIPGTDPSKDEVEE